MEWQLPIQKVEIGNINIGSPWGREQRKEYLQKPMAPLSYFGTHFRLPFISLIFPALPIVEYNASNGRLVLDMSETSLASIKLSTFQDTLVNAILYHQYAWFKSDFTKEEIRYGFQPMFQDNHLVLHCPSQAQQPSGPSGQPSGQAQQPSGQAQQPSGQAQQPSGQAQQPSGQAQQPSGQAQQPSGQAQQPSGQAQPAQRSARPGGRLMGVPIYKEGKWSIASGKDDFTIGKRIRVSVKIHGISFLNRVDSSRNHTNLLADVPLDTHETLQWSGRCRLQHRILGIIVQNEQAPQPQPHQTPSS